VVRQDFDNEYKPYASATIAELTNYTNNRHLDQYSHEKREHIDLIAYQLRLIDQQTSKATLNNLGCWGLVVWPERTLCGPGCTFVNESIWPSLLDPATKASTPIANGIAAFHDMCTSHFCTSSFFHFRRRFNDSITIDSRIIARPHPDPRHRGPLPSSLSCKYKNICRFLAAVDPMPLHRPSRSMTCMCLTTNYRIFALSNLRRNRRSLSLIVCSAPPQRAPFIVIHLRWYCRDRPSHHRLADPRVVAFRTDPAQKP
jgi:hypothetical protein